MAGHLTLFCQPLKFKMWEIFWGARIFIVLQYYIQRLPIRQCRRLLQNVGEREIKRKCVSPSHSVTKSILQYPLISDTTAYKFLHTTKGWGGGGSSLYYFVAKVGAKEKVFSSSKLFNYNQHRSVFLILSTSFHILFLHNDWSLR